MIIFFVKKKIIIIFINVLYYNKSSVKLLFI